LTKAKKLELLLLSLILNITLCIRQGNCRLTSHTGLSLR
jgi:hypothetical protein